MEDDTQKQNTLDALLNEDFQQRVQDDLDGIVEADDAKKAYELADLLEKAYRKNSAELKNYSGLLDFYKKIIIQAKFIALPLFDDDEVINLLKDYFSWHFNIPDYDIFEKFKIKLANKPVYEERDDFKKRLKQALQDSECRIINHQNKHTVRDWLKDYITNLGLGIPNNLQRRQYFTKLKGNENFKDAEWARLKTLFDFFDKLKLSSLSPYGFEEDVPIQLDGKFYIYKQGELEEIKDSRKKNLGPPKTQEERDIEELKEQESEFREGTLERMALDEEIGHKKNLEELKIEAKKHDEGSLERQALEEEIRKMESDRS